MKRKHYFYMLGLSATMLLGACGYEDMDIPAPNVVPGQGSQNPEEVAQGSLNLNLTADAEFASATRALSEENYKNTSLYNVQVINTSNDNVVLECRASELSANLPKTVDIGSYRITANYGAEKAASRDEFLMTGFQVVTVKANENKDVTVNCTPTCGKVSAAFDADMATYYEDYSITFGGTTALGANTFAWSKTDSEPWYVAVKDGGENLTYTISLTAKEDYLHKDDAGNTDATGVVTGTFKLERNKAHKLTVKPNYIPTTDGGMKLTITIDESTNDHEITYEVPITWI